MSSAMSDRAFLRVTALAAVEAPEGEAEERAVTAARKVLGVYGKKVVGIAREREAPPASGTAGSPARSPLRQDEPRPGLAEGAALELAPERATRLVLAPRVLPGLSD